jgi:hypothetical protein
VQTFTVVEADDVVGDIDFCLRVVGIFALLNPFHFQIQEEAFRDGIVPAVSFAAHAANEAVTGQLRLVLGTCEAVSEASFHHWRKLLRDSATMPVPAGHINPHMVAAPSRAAQPMVHRREAVARAGHAPRPGWTSGNIATLPRYIDFSVRRPRRGHADAGVNARTFCAHPEQT